MGKRLSLNTSPEWQKSILARKWSLRGSSLRETSSFFIVTNNGQEIQIGVGSTSFDWMTMEESSSTGTCSSQSQKHLPTQIRCFNLTFAHSIVGKWTALLVEKDTAPGFLPPGTCQA